MKTLTLPNEFFQLLTELESNLALAEHQAKAVASQVAKQIPNHFEKQSLAVHHYYLNQGIKEINQIRARFNNMRHYFIPTL